MLKGFNLVCDVQHYWGIVEKKCLVPSRQRQYQDLIEPITKLYSDIIEYQARVICHLSRHQLARAWEKMAGWYDWDGKSAEIHRKSEQYRAAFNFLKEDETWELQLRHKEKLQDIHDAMQAIPEATRKEIQKIYNSQQVQDLLLDLASDYEKCKDYNPQRVQGTCEWFLKDERFRKWRDSDFGLLWVSAGPGCGKSVLSRALIDERHLCTKAATPTVCYFFFKDGEENRMYAANALCAILHQLFMQSFPQNSIELAVSRRKGFGKGLTQNFAELWRIFMSCTDSPNIGEIICVLDALDECHREGRQQLIKKMEELYCKPLRPSDSRPKLKFLITSRPYNDMEDSFRTFSDAVAYVRFDGDEKAVQISEEINLVIDAKMDKIAHHLEEDDRREIVEQLKRMEHRTYLWLHLTFGIINQCPETFSMRPHMEALLSNLPSQVSEAYEKILNRSNDEHPTEALLEIVLAAARPFDT